MKIKTVSPRGGKGRQGSSGQGKRPGRSKSPRGVARNGKARTTRASAAVELPGWVASLSTARDLDARDLTQTRHTLLQRLKDFGDEKSWKDFFETYWRLIHATARRVGLTPEECQDVVQETVVGVVRNIHKFKVGSEHGKFKSWLLTLTRWRIADQFRKRPPAAASQFPHMDEDTNGTPTIEALADPASLDIDSKWETDWQQNIIDSAIARVKERVDPLDYQMFDLHVLKLWPAAKVAALLNVKLSNVYFAKYDILRRIKSEVKKIERDLV